MKNNRARFRGDLQVDGSIIGRDGQPIEFGGGGSVDLAHLTELAFGDASDIVLTSDLDDYGPGSLRIQGVGDGVDNTYVTLYDPDNDRNDYLELQAGQGSAGISMAMDDPTYGVANAGMSPWSGFSVYRHQIADFWPVFSTFLNEAGNVDNLFKIDLHGKLHWGNGYSAPNVSLERADSDTWWGDASGFLKLSGPEGLDAGLLIGDALIDGGAGVMLTETGLDVYGDPGSPSAGIGTNGLYTGGNMGTVHGSSFNASPLYTAQQWTGDAFAKFARVKFAAVDTYSASQGVGSGWGYDKYSGMLEITRWGAEEPGSSDIFLDLRVAGGGNWREFSIIRDGVLGWHNGADSPDVTLKRHAAGLLEIPQNGGGYVAHSPDGTAYKLTPPNGGGAATWVAA